MGLLDRIKDDIELMPEIEKTLDDIDIKFYTVGYKEELYYKSELLAFIYASINSEWDIIEGFDTNKGLFHFYLQKDNTIYDPSLALITSKEIYSKTFKQFTTNFGAQNYFNSARNEQIENGIIANDKINQNRLSAYGQILGRISKMRYSLSANGVFNHSDNNS